MIKAQIFHNEYNNKFMVSINVDKEVQLIGTHKKAGDAMISVLHLHKEIPMLKIILDRTTARKLGSIPGGANYDIEVYEEI